MTLAKRIAVLCGLAALAWVVPIGQAAAQSAHFSLRICNKSDVNAGVAVAFRSDPQTWMVVGWIVVSAGECRDIGSALKGNFYAYAEEVSNRGSKIVWAGNDVQLCVEYPGPFQRVNTDGYTCGDNEQLKGFTRMFAEENTGTYTMNLNP